MIVDAIKERTREGCVSKVQIEDFQDTEAVHAAMEQMLVDTHTGNHTSRNRQVRVPTRPGQPVRG